MWGSRMLFGVWGLGIQGSQVSEFRVYGFFGFKV